MPVRFISTESQQELLLHQCVKTPSFCRSWAARQCSRGWRQGGVVWSPSPWDPLGYLLSQQDLWAHPRSSLWCHGFQKSGIYLSTGLFRAVSIHSSMHLFICQHPTVSVVASQQTDRGPSPSFCILVILGLLHCQVDCRIPCCHTHTEVGREGRSTGVLRLLPWNIRLSWGNFKSWNCWILKSMTIISMVFLEMKSNMPDYWKFTIKLPFSMKIKLIARNRLYF